jgi:hypothetical protein
LASAPAAPKAIAEGFKAAARKRTQPVSRTQATVESDIPMLLPLNSTLSLSKGSWLSSTLDGQLDGREPGRGQSPGRKVQISVICPFG